MICEIEDNGIGREQALIDKSKYQAEYQSRGIEIIEERILVLNKKYKQKIFIQIVDKKDEMHRAIGTLVRLELPNYEIESTHH